MQDFHLLEKLANFNRERIPERVVHAKDSGAFGTLTITHDITKYTKAKVFSEVGKQTPMLTRFSTVAGERGAADAMDGVPQFITDRQLEHFTKADQAYGEGVRKALENGKAKSANPNS